MKRSRGMKRRNHCGRSVCLQRKRKLNRAIEACRFVREFLLKLEDSIRPDDVVLRQCREHFHRPLHEKLDSVLGSREPNKEPA